MSLTLIHGQNPVVSLLDTVLIEPKHAIALIYPLKVDNEMNETQLKSYNTKQENVFFEVINKTEDSINTIFSSSKLVCVA